jgi:imidazolonepropionase-like amidohydrolase
MVLPGLIDMHTHLVDQEQTENIAEPLLTTAAYQAYIGAAHARVTLEAGFTSVRDVGTWRAFGDVALRDAIDAGLVPGPRMSVAGAYITIPGGGGEITGIAADVGIPAEMRVGVVEDAADAHRKAANILAHHADFLKLIATGAVLTVGTEPGQQELTEDEMRAAIEEAAKRGTYATAHAHGAEGMKSAMRAGVRSIEHGSLMDDEAIAMMKAKGVFLVADIYDGDWIDAYGKAHGWPAETLRKNYETTEAQRVGFRKAVKAGVKIAYGTDAGVYPHGLNARQLPYMVRYGMTPMQAIQSATTVAAELMKKTDVGAVAPGRYADLIAVDGDAHSRHRGAGACGGGDEGRGGGEGVGAPSYTFSQREKEGPAPQAWEDEGLRRQPACRHGWRLAYPRTAAVTKAAMTKPTQKAVAIQARMRARDNAGSFSRNGAGLQ